MDELLIQLKKDFSDFSCSVNGSSLNMQTLWRGKTRGVEAVEVYIEGIDPLTGDKFSKKATQFSITKTSHQHPTSSLYGNYVLRFEAVGEDGTHLGSFRDVYPIQIKGSGIRPYIKYSVTPVGGWLQLRIKSNCWQRCADHLWVKASGHLQRLHRNNSKNDIVNFYFPQEQREPLLFADDNDIPTPVKEANI